VPAPIPADKRAAILADIKAGRLTRGAIARKHDVSTTTVSNVAKNAHVNRPFSREQTKKATEARQADNAARRSALGTAWLDLAEAAIGQARAELHDARADKAATIAGIATDKHIALERHDAGDGADDARSMLTGIMTGLGALWQQHSDSEGAGDAP
jgi:transposase-like protein